MSIVADILFFCYPPQDLVWVERSVISPQLHTSLSKCVHSVALDLMERYAAVGSFRVSLHEMETCPLKDAVSIGKVNRVATNGDRLEERVLSALRQIYDNDPASRVGVYIGCNPLYPPELFEAGMELLEQDDDVVAFGDTGLNPLDGVRHPSRRPAWIGLKAFPREFVFDGNFRLDKDSIMKLGGTDVLLMPVRGGAENVSSVNDLRSLLHNIEREVLLKKWYPKRTLDSLRQMHRDGLI